MVWGNAVSLLATLDTKTLQIWQSFVKKEALTVDQAEKFEQYLFQLIEWNKKSNLTSIDTVPDILAYHFQDSLRIGDFITFKPGQTLCDVGSGGGFPGIPLKILYPDVKVILIEVNSKKIHFLESMITLLGLKDIEVCSLDWRAFLRDAPYSVDYFFARASLRPDELTRLFKPGCVYKESTLVYWASQQWVLDQKEAIYYRKEHEYQVGNKKDGIFFLA
jgi:16S rRNA (guanine(527)-N(7))-methyltransferase GidB